ncbi:MAG: hypothetical protein WD342_13035 [Verrucomicrobiales bacterium]
MTDTPVPERLKIKTVNEISKEDIRELTERFSDSETVVTLMMPMETAGAETRKNPIVFKNALNEACEKLEQAGGYSRPLKQQFREVDDLCENPVHEFWQHQEAGLLVFLDGNEDIRGYRLPVPIGPDVRIGKSPHLTPLHRFLNPVRRLVLVLDLNETRLFEATRWKVDEIELKDIPTSLEEAMRFDDPEKSLQFRSVSDSNLRGEGGGEAAFHGHGVTTETNRNRKKQRFFEMISADIAKHFPDRNTPLVILGPDAERARYREVNHYEHLSDDEIDLNPSHLEKAELHRHITDHVAKVEEAESSSALARLEDHVGTDTSKGATTVEEVVEAALGGRIETLFVRAGARQYGTVDLETFRTEPHDSAEEGDTELVAFATNQAAMTNASIRVLDDGATLPGDSPVAAILRY